MSSTILNACAPLGMMLCHCHLTGDVVFDLCNPAAQMVQLQRPQLLGHVDFIVTPVAKHVAQGTVMAKATGLKPSVVRRKKIPEAM